MHIHKSIRYAYRIMNGFDVCMNDSMYVCVYVKHLYVLPFLQRSFSKSLNIDLLEINIYTHTNITNIYYTAYTYIHLTVTQCIPFIDFINRENE